MKKILMLCAVVMALCSCGGNKSVSVQLSSPVDGTAPRVVVFEFDGEGNLVAPLEQLVAFKKNSKLRVYTYDRHKDVYSDRGYKGEVTETFYFDGENRLVKYEATPDNKEYFILYEGGVTKAVYSDVKSNYLIYTHEKGATTKQFCTRDMSENERYKFNYQNMPEPLMYMSENYAYCMANKLNMRQRSYDNSVDLSKEPVLESIVYGDCLQVLSDADQNGWMQVRNLSSGRVGFVMTDYVVPEKDYLRFQSAVTPALLKQMTQSRDRIVLIKYLKRNGMIGTHADTYNTNWVKYFGDGSNYTPLRLTSVKVISNDEWDYEWIYRYGIEGARPVVVNFNQFDDNFK